MTWQSSKENFIIVRSCSSAKLFIMLNYTDNANGDVPFTFVEGPQCKYKLYRHVLCYPADSKGDSDIFNILISPISNFFYLFLFQLPNCKFFYWQINTYLFTYFNSRKCVIFLVSLSSRCAHVLLQRNTKELTDQSSSL